MRVIWAAQYNMNCIVAEQGDTGPDVLARCWRDEAVRFEDGTEFCVQLRTENGPELWTEDALLGSLPSAPVDAAG